MMQGKGFTLVELAIVITIIGLLIAGVLKGQSLINDAKVSSAITLAQDISVAVNAFKQQYHMLPGDMAVTTADIPNISTGCQLSGGSTNNGLIDNTTESQCVPEVLFKAGLTKQPTFSTDYGPVVVKASKTVLYLAPSIAAGVFPATHVVEFQNLPCEVVQAMDRKIDDDNLTSGKAIAAYFTPDTNNPNTCLAGSPVPSYAVAL